MTTATKYPYPRTIEEMAVKLAAEMAAKPPAVTRLPAERPRCREHGYMTLRPLERQTYEQRFCGTWYDCGHCGASMLYYSRDLCHQLGEPYDDGTQWWRYDGQAWQPIAAAEAEAFFQQREDERSQRELAQRRARGRTPRALRPRRGDGRT